MVINKLEQIKYNNNDIYLTDVCDDKILINTNYNGVLLFYSSLAIEQKISLPNNTIIYRTYKKYDENKIILYSPDDNQMTFINIDTKETLIVPLPSFLTNNIFSANYYWQGNALIFTTYNNNFYQFSFESRQFNEISLEIIKSTYSYFFKFWNICKDYDILTVYPHEQSFIFQENTGSIIYFDCKQNKKITAKNFNDGWHEVEYNNGTFIFIHENKIEFLNDNQKITIQPQVDYIFLKAKFLNKNTVAITSSKPSDPKKSLLEVYEIK
jgi:hypothetical protein